MKNHRQQVAWVILLASFALCVAVAVGLPLGVRHVLRTARAEEKVALEPQRGTPRMQLRGRGAVIALIGPTWDVPPDTVVTTDGSAQGLLTLYAPGQEPSATAAIQIYGDTEVVLVSAHSPRYRMSPLPHEAVLEVRAGRVRVSISPSDERPAVVNLRTPHMNAELHEGSYEIRVRPALSELTVRDGSAEVTSAGGESVTLQDSERTVAQIGDAQLAVLSAERNLLRNGSFRQLLEEGWVVYHRDVQQAPEGTVEVTTSAGRPAAWFHRNGVGHAEVGIRQEVYYDVRDFSSLVLHFSVQVREQSLLGCGSVGSECPIIARIDYRDIYGNDNVWYRGFYASEPADSDLLHPWDEQVPLQTWVTFDSGNLMEILEEPPALIRAVAVYASGHSFDALVTEVELLAQE
jgi:hypothetical protein